MMNVSCKMVQRRTCETIYFHFFRDIFADHIISQCSDSLFWSACSPNLTPCDFYLLGTLNEQVFKNNPETTEAMKEEIKNAIPNISHQIAFGNIIKRTLKCVQSSSDHFEYCMQRRNLIHLSHVICIVCDRQSYMIGIAFF